MFKKAIGLTVVGLGLIFINARAESEYVYPLKDCNFNADDLIEDCLKTIVIHCKEAIENKKEASICALEIEEELGYLKSWILRKHENAHFNQ